MSGNKNTSVKKWNNLKAIEFEPKHIVLSGDMIELAYYYMEGSLYRDM